MIVKTSRNGEWIDIKKVYIVIDGKEYAIDECIGHTGNRLRISACGLSPRLAIYPHVSNVIEVRDEEQEEL